MVTLRITTSTKLNACDRHLEQALRFSPKSLLDVLGGEGWLGREEAQDIGEHSLGCNARLEARFECWAEKGRYSKAARVTVSRGTSKCISAEANSRYRTGEVFLVAPAPTMRTREEDILAPAVF